MLLEGTAAATEDDASSGWFAARASDAAVALAGSAAECSGWDHPHGPLAGADCDAAARAVGGSVVGSCLAVRAALAALAALAASSSASRLSLFGSPGVTGRIRISTLLEFAGCWRETTLLTWNRCLSSFQLGLLIREALGSRDGGA